MSKKEEPLVVVYFLSSTSRKEQVCGIIISGGFRSLKTMKSRNVERISLRCSLFGFHCEMQVFNVRPMHRRETAEEADPQTDTRDARVHTGAYSQRTF